MGDTDSAWALHRQIEQAVPQSPERLGFAALQGKLDVGQRGRVKRAATTLVGLDVLRWEGMRQGRAVAQGPRTLEEVLAAGLTPVPDREIQTYPLLTAPLDAFITRWHEGRVDPIDTSGGPTSVDDGVWTYVTSTTKVERDGHSSVHTRPDLTVVVDLEFTHFGSWNDIHSVEVKPYWAVDRAALFEAAAQAALRRCTFSWLLVWIPEEDPSHFRPDQLVLIDRAKGVLAGLEAEAKDLGLGLLRAQSLAEDESLEKLADPRRQVIEPKAAEDLFQSLGRTDSARGITGS